jgi:hypothetical protein
MIDSDDEQKRQELKQERKEINDEIVKMANKQIWNNTRISDAEIVEEFVRKVCKKYDI